MGNVLQNTGGNTLKIHGGGVFGSAAASVAAGSTLEINGLNAVDRVKVEDASCALYGNSVFTTDAGKTWFTNAQYTSNSMGMELNSTIGHNGFGEIGGVFDFSTCGFEGGKVVKGQEIWLRVKMKFPIGFTFNVNGRNKFMRLRAGHDDGSGGITSEGFNDLYINGLANADGDNSALHWIFEGVAMNWVFGNAPMTLADGNWHTYEMYLKLDNIKGSAGGTSMVRSWIDGVLQIESNARETLQTADSYLYNLNFFTYWDNAGATANQTWWADDLKLTTATPTATDASGNYMIGVS